MSERVRGNKFLTGKQLDKMEEGEEFFVQVFTIFNLFILVAIQFLAGQINTQ